MMASRHRLKLIKVAILKWFVPLGILYCVSINKTIAVFVFVFLLFALVVPKDIIFWHCKPSKYHAIFYLMLTLTIISIKYNNTPISLPSQLSCAQHLPNDWNDGKFIFQRIDSSKLSIMFKKNDLYKSIELYAEQSDGRYVLKSRGDDVYFIDEIVHISHDKYALQFTVVASNNVFNLNCYGVM
jgi:hypothetical protein